MAKTILVVDDKVIYIADPATGGALNSHLPDGGLRELYSIGIV